MDTSNASVKPQTAFGKKKKKCVCWCILTETLGLICIAWLNCALRTFLSPSDDQICNESDKLINSKQARSLRSRHTPLVAESSHHILTDYTALKSYFVNSFLFAAQCSTGSRQLMKKNSFFKSLIGLKQLTCFCKHSYKGGSVLWVQCLCLGVCFFHYWDILCKSF